MGNLTADTPHSEVTATLEILDYFGVTREDLKKFRGSSQVAQARVIAQLIALEQHKGSKNSGSEKKVALLNMTTTMLDALPFLSTQECFVRGWENRLPGYFAMLPPYQQSVAECQVSAYRTINSLTAAAIATVALRLPANAPFDDLERQLKDRDLLLSMSQICELVERHRHGMVTGICSKARGTYAFSEKADGGVFLAEIYLNKGSWTCDVCSFGYAHPLPAGTHVLLKNLNERYL